MKPTFIHIILTAFFVLVTVLHLLKIMLQKAHGFMGVKYSYLTGYFNL